MQGGRNSRELDDRERRCGKWVSTLADKMGESERPAEMRGPDIHEHNRVRIDASIRMKDQGERSPERRKCNAL